MKAKVYQDKSGQFRWTLTASNGRIIADSSEGYQTREGAKDGLALVRKAMSDEELTIEDFPITEEE